MIEFVSDVDVDLLRPAKSVEDLAVLLRLLAGREASPAAERLVEIHQRLDHALGGAQDVDLSREQLNELLLLAGESRVSAPFFDCFLLGHGLSDTPLRRLDNLNELAKGVRRFRGLAMLAFGNFRHAFRTWSSIDDHSTLCSRLRPWSTPTSVLAEELKNRPRSISSISVIPETQTWHLGYLSVSALPNDLALASAIYAISRGEAREQLMSRLQEDPELEKVRAAVMRYWTDTNAPSRDVVNRWKDTIESVLKDGVAEYKAHLGNIKRGVQNGLRYLTWDYMDVYIATSMRNQWEFQETYDVARSVMYGLKDEGLRVRWFDPTQSFESNVSDKGLVEALMLKRARCTLFMVQETDTLGKDSELAATLAQGKPVIAFLRPTRTASELEAFFHDISRRPVAYLRKRLHMLAADDFFRDQQNLRSIAQNLDRLGITSLPQPIPEYVAGLLGFADELARRRTFVLVGTEDESDRQQIASSFPDAMRLVTAAEAVSLEKRASVLARSHPLAMQVHLETGVANGVLVARSTSDCAAIIGGFLTNNLRFHIQAARDTSERRIATVLVEDKTKSYFRQVTHNSEIENSFWNYYLQKESS